MSKPTPAHHKTVTLPISEVENGYHGVRILGVKAYVIVAAAQVHEHPPLMPELIRVIVAPARTK